jgi:hypothetical protein
LDAGSTAPARRGLRSMRAESNLSFDIRITFFNA